MAEHYWLSRRARALQEMTTAGDLPTKDQERQFLLFLRYQTTNDRAFHRALNDLLKLRAEKRKAEIGFVSQRQKKAQESRREAAEKRKQDVHRLNVLFTEAKIDYQHLLNTKLERDAQLDPEGTNELSERQIAALRGEVSRGLHN